MSFEDRILPELRPVLHRLPQMDLERDLPMMRDFKLPPLPKSPDVRTTNLTIEGPESELLLKVYESADRPDTKLPAVYWIHGGGYVLGHPDGDDPLCEQFVLDAGCVAFSIDYRLAPDHPYPAAIEDCYTGLSWVADRAQELRIDASKIAIAGASAAEGMEP
jgi:acetyl esterase/lipase